MMFLTGLLLLMINVWGLNAQENEVKEIYLAHPYDDDFHIVFGMIVSTFLIMLTFLSMAVIAIWTMDPGRDSIIYRMTSQKIKKND